MRIPLKYALLLLLLLLCLFKDVVSSSRYIASNGTTINELKRIWKKADMAYRDILSQNPPGEAEENYNNFGQGSECVSLEIRTGPLPSVNYKLCSQAAWPQGTQLRSHFTRLCVSVLNCDDRRFTITQSVQEVSYGLDYSGLTPNRARFLLFSRSSRPSLGPSQTGGGLFPQM